MLLQTKDEYYSSTRINTGIAGIVVWIAIDICIACMYMYIYIYIHTCIYIYIYVSMYMYIYMGKLEYFTNLKCWAIWG